MSTGRGRPNKSGLCYGCQGKENTKNWISKHPGYSTEQSRKWRARH